MLVGVRLQAGMCIKQKPVAAPKCTASALWQKAIAKGAPASGAVANLGYRASIINGKVEWWFDIGEAGDKVFDARFIDGC